ncbi:glycosyltransferase family protein [Neolewinella antarctica]|uniref:Uncharacterized protein n=1 Tax=Neolewinella antarctica TaxID=442734 RepID=A0ABX0XCH6_9BACT|nr:hypothetical protein [Neolewinella antarctica]NJC26644.1 hypothetical protein [Neolewinella antarctica]
MSSKNILFVCGSLEPGKDGVGDYARALAAEILRGGGVCSLVSTHDKAVDAVTREAQATDSSVSVATWRIPRKLSDERRMAALQKCLKATRPTYVSLQFVPYSFSKKGIPLGLAKFAKAAFSDIPVHIMFHELWLTKKGLVADPKRYVTSASQKYAIHKLILHLRPRLIHTHIPEYQRRLKSLGVPASPLPLFSNIVPVNDTIVKTKVEDAGLRIALFSKLSTKEPIMDVLKAALNWSIGEFGKGRVDLIGGNAEVAKELKARLETEVAGVQVNVTGHLPASEVSAHLAACHLALTPVPSWVLGKSGTVAAFLSHGLPVYAPMPSGRAEVGFFDDTLAKFIRTAFDPADFLRMLDELEKASKASIALPFIARKLLHDLDAA